MKDSSSDWYYMKGPMLPRLKGVFDFFVTPIVPTNASSCRSLINTLFRLPATLISPTTVLSLF